MNRTHRLKVSDGGEGDTLSIDRLSDFPDSILCHILSFLSTKTSIRTSILATRWRFVWKFVPNLHFYRENRDFITRVLSLHKLPSINTLRLHLGDDSCSENQIETWIIAAVARNVRNLDISHILEKKFQLPLCLLTCETLVDLRIDYCCIIPLANTVWLPLLKKLNLTLVRFEADESLPRLLWGCPVLEYLQITLEIKGPDESLFCNISSPSVKRLELCLHPAGRFHQGFRLKIDTPAIVYLWIEDYSSKHIESGMMTSLTEANISLCNDKKKGGDFVYSQSVLQFFNSLCNVRRLDLYLGDPTKIIHCIATRSFHNLTELKLTADASFLPMFLKNADNLEMLKFCELCDEGERAWVEPEQVPMCLSSHLRTVKIGFGESNGFEIVSYLLRNARILERVEIMYRSDLDGKNRLIEEISKIERRSKACKLALTYLGAP